MNFELGKKYIVDVTSSGIIPSMEFDEDRWYDKDHDDLDFLTDEEKIVVINQVLDKIRAEIEQIAKDYDKFADYRRVRGLWIALKIIDKYKAEVEPQESEVKNEDN